MRARNDRNISLAIETAVRGGSLSIFEDGREVCGWIGQTAVSKAEEILEQIENLFEQYQIKKKSVKMIAVSSGPGSSTGIKIGLALAKGLSKGFGCPIISVSALESLIGKAVTKPAGEVLTALPVGKNLIAWQSFGSGLPGGWKAKGAHVTELKSFTEEVIDCYAKVIAHQDIFERYINDVNEEKSIENAGENIATFINMNAIVKVASDNE